MRKVNVLFFAADPLSIRPDGSSPRLLLDEEVRQIKKRVGASVFGNLLDFDWRLAARVRDLQQTLEETHPQIVHFSGHGESTGLVLAAANGRTPRRVDSAVLRELFERDPGDIRLIVLTACNSLEHAEAVKEVVGCAIGTRDLISDDASITFNAKFYSAIASGRSVQDAFERARMALRLEHPAEGEILQLVHREDVDPAKLVLVSRVRRYTPIAAAVTTGLIVVAAGLIKLLEPEIVDPPSGVLRLGDCGSSRTAASTVGLAAAMEIENPSEGATNLDQAKAFCRAGQYDSAVAFFKRAADEGSPEAMSFLAIAYLSGEGTNRDSILAMDWLDRAAKEKRDPRGMNALAVVYENDENMTGRYRWSKHWYEQSAKLGFAEAMRNLARFHHRGLGGSRNDSAALHWANEAVRSGLVDAMVDIGQMYERGVNERRDPGEALRLYRTAAEAGSALGMYATGRAYQEGIGVSIDYGQARHWFLKGACAGSAEAMYSLGLLYQKGLGGPVDRDQAVEWMRRAANAGSSVAAASLNRLERRGLAKVVGLLDQHGSAPLPVCDTITSSPQKHARTQ